MENFLPDYFRAWHLVVVFFAGLIGEGYGTMVGGGGVVIQFVLATLGMPLASVVATDLAGSMGASIGVITATPKKVWSNKKLLFVLGLPLFIGGIIGTAFLIKIPVELLKYVIIAGLTLLLLYVLFSKPSLLRSLETLQISKKQHPLIFFTQILQGIYGNVSGVGSGTFERISFIALLRISVADSIGVINIIGLPTVIFSFVATAIAGFIVWPYLITLWVGTFIGGRYAAKYIRIIPDKYLRALLVVLAIIYIVYLLRR
ncbi:MAG: sulfite exporter TauE/SafE family protein [Candidatus Doudnabacteria bacterium]|nr:sulfite exporter TauE/SafE family protein [Candidatus Doudnabacteria bacterium]